MNVRVGSWTVFLDEDDDGHLTFVARHDDGTSVVDCEADLCTDDEWGTRFTTQGIEAAFLASQNQGAFDDPPPVAGQHQSNR